MKLKKLALISAMAGMMTTGTAMAADGSLVTGAAATTTGSIGSTTVRLDVPDRVQISSMPTEIVLTEDTPGNTSYSGDSGATVCIFRNGTGDVTIEASSDNLSGTTLRMSDGGTSFIPYTVTVNGANITTAGSDVTASATRSPSCAGAGDALSTIAVNAADVYGNATSTGSHSDTLTLTVKAR